jgi:hypothetical protein
MEEDSSKNIKYLGIAVVVLVALAAITLTGIAVISQFKDALQVSSTITNETITIASGAGSFANSQITSFVFLDNATHRLINANETTDARFNITAYGSTDKSFKTRFIDGSYYASYVYDANTEGANVADQFITGLGIFGAFVGVLAISVIGKGIVLLFKRP